MATKKKGTAIGLTDCNYNDIRIGNTLRFLPTGDLYVVNKYGRAANDKVGSRQILDSSNAWEVISAKEAEALRGQAAAPAEEPEGEVVDINLDDIPEAPELKDREQAEALAAENERLTKENEELKELIREVEEAADGCAKDNTGLQKDLNEAIEARKASEDARLKALEELAASELEREALTSEINRLKGENLCLQDIVKAQDGAIGKAKAGAAACGLDAYDTGALVEELTRRGFVGHIERHDEYDI